MPYTRVAGEQSIGSRLGHLLRHHKADAPLTDAQAGGTRRGVLLEPIAGLPGLHDQEHHVHALGLAQRDGVALPTLPSSLLHQAPYLGPQIEHLQRAVQMALRPGVRSTRHTLASFATVLIFHSISQ